MNGVSPAFQKKMFFPESRKTLLTLSVYREEGFGELFGKVDLALRPAAILLLLKKVKGQFAVIDLDDRNLAAGFTETVASIHAVCLFLFEVGAIGDVAGDAARGNK